MSRHTVIEVALSKGPNRVGVFPHLRTETDPVSETLCFSLLFRKNPDNGQSPKTQYLCVLYTIVRTLQYQPIQGL
jgi:hypothetical protein